MRTLFLNPPSYDDFDGGAGSRYQAKREVWSFWYPTWLAYPAGLVPGARLLVLDPFVRLHRIDENISGEVAPLLAYLRELQRRYHVAVVLVHHARKGGAKMRAGQALRGSSEFHAWGDSNLYLRRKGDALQLTIEHRAAPSTGPLALELRSHGPALALHVVDAPPEAAIASVPIATIADRIAAALVAAPGPLGIRELRDACRVRTARLIDELAALTAAGRVVKSAAGYRLTR